MASNRLNFKIPKRTKDLVSGFIRQIETLLEKDRRVPNDIILICIDYTWNDFKEERIKLEEKLIKRPRVEEMEILIVGMELRFIAQRHRRYSTPIELATRLPWEEEPDQQVNITQIKDELPSGD